MQNIDLIDYADHSVKIPSPLLNKFKQQKEVPAWKIGLAHLLDFGLICWANLIIHFLLSSSTSTFLMSNKLQNILAVRGQTANVIVFGTTLFGYFFFSYFLNHGQSLGLLAIKKRIPMKDKSFRNAARWALYSSAICMTFGLALRFFKGKNFVATHDYLYHDLMTVKEIQYLDLRELTAHSKVEEETYLEAA